MLAREEQEEAADVKPQYPNDYTSLGLSFLFYMRILATGE